mmetsp:Transcript_48043/g.104626  ORF Transcript_48043/g.104626 Transcript_48043/m.104626 type:complete len:268 (-) Transcript_48043:88-891(-)
MDCEAMGIRSNRMLLLGASMVVGVAAEVEKKEALMFAGCIGGTAAMFALASALAFIGWSAADGIQGRAMTGICGSLLFLVVITCIAVMVGDSIGTEAEEGHMIFGCWAGVAGIIFLCTALSVIGQLKDPWNQTKALSMAAALVSFMVLLVGGIGAILWQLEWADGQGKMYGGCIGGVFGIIMLVGLLGAKGTFVEAQRSAEKDDGQQKKALLPPVAVSPPPAPAMAPMPQKPVVQPKPAVVEAAAPPVPKVAPDASPSKRYPDKMSL